MSLILFFFFFFLNLSPLTAQQQRLSSFSISDSPWRPNQNRILVSPNSTFAAGFRSSSKSPQLYIFAIWYLNTSFNTSVWSINGDSPVNRSSSLVITSSGSLQLNDSTGKNLWIPAPIGKPNTSELLLGEDGNLVFENWKSFDYPTNTFLPTQPINANVTLVSENGNYTFRNSTNLVFNSTDVYWTNSNIFQELQSTGNLKMATGDPMISSDTGFNHLRRLTLDDDGNLRVHSLDPNSGKWVIVWQAIQELCTIYGKCGSNYICVDNGFNVISCVCPPGFHEINGLCERKIPLSTRPQDSKFLQLDYVNYTGGLNQTNLKAQNFSTCEALCLAKSNCLGFGFKFSGQNYCVLQIDHLLYGHWSPGTETAMFLRVSKSESDVSNFTGMTTMIETTCPIRISLPLPPDDSNTTARNVSIISTLFAIELISGVLAFWAFLKKYIKYRDMAQSLGLEFLPAGGPQRFTYAELKSATNNFSNVVGHGGFGIVYKGVLPDHRIVAVKRLKDVAGGDAEFWAEVTIIARMHHLNLVRMWGFCAEKSQRMLVYEYIPNGSLDKFLFQANPPPASASSETSRNDSITSDTPPNVQQQRPKLDWNIRYRIALGVARAIAYLHEECLEWVLHCDIKPENILLEDDFCPKVSDFGLAKLAKKEDVVSMSRIRGTRGYLAPEWVKMEPITAKADVYSFGMVLLEIVSGVRNFEFRRSSLESEDWYFPRWAFEKVYKEMKVDDILDRRILDCYDSRAHFDMVNRMVKTAMWCLQDRAEMRPSMGKVAKMLEGTVEITEPAKPTLFYLTD